MCNGNVRSTPTPEEILRTVKVSEIPPPRRLITTPSNTWIRSREPSTIRTCTRKVSPVRNVGKSVRNCDFVTLRLTYDYSLIYSPSTYVLA